MADKNHKNVEVSNLKVTVSGDKKTAYASWEPPTGNVSRVFRKKGVASKTYTSKKSSRTAKYEVRWRYFQLDRDGAKRYVTSSKTTQQQRNATLSIPEGATGIWCYVKPISTEFTDYVPKKDSKGKVQKGKYDEKKHKWYSGKEIHQKEAANTGAIHAPQRPDAPQVSVGDDGTTLTIRCKSNDPYTAVYFLRLAWEGGSKTVQWPDAAKVRSTDYRQVADEHTFVESGVAGRTYTADCYIKNTYNADHEKSGWSPKSQPVKTKPAAPGRPTAKAQGDGAVVSWPKAAGAETYEVEYSDDTGAFGTDQSQTASTEGVTSIPFAELEQARAWFFRVRAVNSTGPSNWSPLSAALLLGKPPTAPTVWSSAMNAVKGEKVVLYWKHNTADGSDQAAARLTYNPGTGDRVVVLGSEGEYALDTSAFADGTQVLWNVQTAGVTGEYGPKSENRVVRVWEQPTVRIDVLPLIARYPFTVTVDPESPTQRAVAIDLSVRAVAEHTVVNPDGTERSVAAGEEVFSRHFANPADPLGIALSAGDITLADGQGYEIIAACAMSSSLTCAATARVDTEFEPLDFMVQGVIEEHGRYAAEVRPFAVELPASEGEAEEPAAREAQDEEDEGAEMAYAPDIELSVYRHESDGSMTPLARKLPNDGTVTLVDRHASLGTQSYRVVALDRRTGRIDYDDVSDRVVLCNGIVIQWEGGNAASYYVGDEAADAPDSSGTVLELGKGIKVSYQAAKDGVLRPFIGRRHPASRYGTQLGTGCTLSFSFPRRDSATVALLRELETLMDDCYVREPMGAGYWAMAEVKWDWSADSAVASGTIEVSQVDRVDECVVGS
ncbi:fibronectin type III domain-containing protein [Eggerthellaceae bacterium 24-137]